MNGTNVNHNYDQFFKCLIKEQSISQFWDFFNYVSFNFAEPTKLKQC